MRAWRTLTDPPQLWRFPFCCRQSLAADPAPPPGDVPSLNVWLREIRCDGSQGWQVAEVSQSVWAACDGKGDERSFLHFLPAGVSGSIKKPTEKREKSPSAFKDRFYYSNRFLCLPTAFSLVQLIKEPLPMPWAALDTDICLDTAWGQEALPQMGHRSWHQILLSLSQEVAEMLAVGGREEQGCPGHLRGTSTWVWC